MTQPLLELGGPADGRLMHIAPANGFVLQTYLPMLASLQGQYRTFSLPPRALWEASPPALTPTNSWYSLGQDFSQGLRAYDLRDVVAVGHSFGGIAALYAAKIDPTRFRAIILLDPTIMTPAICALLREASLHGTSDQHPLAQKAARRRRDFADVEEALAFFQTRNLFADWDPEALRLYARYGTQADGDGRTLTWSPEWETYYFSTGAIEIWDELPAFDGLAPMLIIRGGASDTYIAESAEVVRTLLPQATHTELPGHGHLFPHSAPQATAEIIRDWLRNIP